MTRERFSDILKEYDYSDAQIELLWNSRPEGYEGIGEERLRKTAARVAPIKDKLIQA